MSRSPTDVSPDILVSYFNNILPLSTEEGAWVAVSFHARLYRRKQYVLQEGDQCLHFNFVVRGCLRLYKIVLETLPYGSHRDVCFSVLP